VGATKGEAERVVIGAKAFGIEAGVRIDVKHVEIAVAMVLLFVWSAEGLREVRLWSGISTASIIVLETLQRIAPS
jgi:hypothetical protein